jgi:large subunit ribosomal protein L25
VDLQEVQADRPITVRVAVHAVGEAVGVREQKGILQLVMHEVEVECLPTRIPERLEADVTRLRIGDVLTVGELPVPEGVRILNPADQAVCTVAPPMAEEAAAPAPAVTAEPEVLTERRAKEEAGAEDEGKRERTKR